ncbi:hypothetical protein LC613_01080 [Nostoc sphaeroides CHAB 2801]|uniref:hypothetical protein n=1 Tax=Nostoc sphaeroides TaxID=446679 RepID=UPI000E509949|nr:hypothetical protein [Nostoc sphaeroides]MCC5626857.1 hypothetical protein [Nostoc sphaeroides CHAB 2801]
MAIAIRTNTTLTPTITQATLINAIKAAMANAGFPSLYSEFTAGTDICLIYEWIVDSTKNFGKVYIRIRITTGLLIAQQIFSAWNTGTNTGTNGSTEASYGSLSASSTINFVALNGADEYRLVALAQGSTLMPIGVLMPAFRQEFWDLNSWTYGFIFTSSAMTILRGVIAANNPYANSDFDLLLVGNSRLTNVNNQTNQPDLARGLLMLTQSNQGIAAATSEDFAVGAFLGQTRFTDAIPPGTTQTYVILQNLAGGVAIKYQ